MTPVHRPSDWRARGELQIARAVKAYSQRWPQALPPYTLPAARVLETGEPRARQSVVDAASDADFDARIGEVREIPRTLWAYWHTPELPPLVALCLQGWQRLHPGWRIEVLNEQSARTHVSHWPEALTRATVHQRADWLRLALLHAHGGIWLDASTILTRPLDWVLQAQEAHQTDCLGLYLEALTRLPHYPVMEIGLLAAPAGSCFIAAVLQEFTTHVIEQSAPAYVAHLRNLGIFEQLRQHIDTPLYLTTHLAIQRVLQRQGAEYRLGLWRSEDTGFVYQVQAGWNRARFKQRLLFMRAGDTVAPLVKLRGPDRRKLDLYLANGLYLQESIAGRYLMGAQQP